MWIGIAVVAILLLSGAIVLFNNEEPTPQNTNDDTNNDLTTQDGVMQDTSTQTPNKVFVLTGENFLFREGSVENPDLVVNQGDLVRIEFTSTQGFHDWVVDEFNAATQKVSDTDGLTYVEFVASNRGTFEYYCSVGSHRANGMKGNLIVQ